MRAQTVDVRSARGRILCTTIFRPCGKKLLAKGHTISEEDIQLLETEGLQEVWVTEFDDSEIPEDEAVLAVAGQIGCGSIEIRAAVGGRANLVATSNCCLLLDEELLKQVNCTSAVAIATASNFRFIRAGERVASVKSAPFAISREELDGVLSIFAERGPILQARPLDAPKVAVLYTDPLSGDRARQLFESVMRHRLEKFGTFPSQVLSSLESTETVARGLNQLLRSNPDVVLMASTTAPAGPGDIVGQAMIAAGCSLERFLAPVEPGNLLLLGYAGEIPVVAAPGCFRSTKLNIVDLILPPLLARYRVSGWEIACLGHGGLLS